MKYYKYGIMKDKTIVDTLRKRYKLETEKCQKCQKVTLVTELNENQKFVAYGRICNSCTDEMDL